MRIVNLTEFRKLKPGTVFMKYTPQYFEELCVKGDTWDSDFLCEAITNEIDCNDSGERCDCLFEAQEDSAKSLKLDFDCTGRDGCHDPNQLFAVYEKEDLQGLIRKLQYSLEAYNEDV